MSDRAAPPPLQAAIAHHEAGRFHEADALYRQILATTPDDATVLHLCGLLASRTGNAVEAIGLIGRAALLQPASALVHLHLADALRAAARLTEAAHRYRRAVAIDPQFTLAWHGLGRTLALLGQMDAAVQALQRAVALDPDRTAVHWDLAAAGKDEGIPHLHALLSREQTAPEDRINAGFALAVLLDQAGQYDEAFHRLQEANTQLQAHLAANGETHDPARLRADVDQRIACFQAAYFEQRRNYGSAAETPVFIVGMPRSGTTLVEQILSSHSRVRGIGEGHAIGALVSGANAASATDGDWPADACRRLADAHIARLRVLGGGADLVVDKTPDNLFHLALIAVLFPQARVIVCRRDPRDTCLSCYFQNFAHPMPYANDLAACADRLRQVDRLLEHWQTVLPLRMHTVRYESLVAGLEGESRRLIAFLGLDWEPGCLEFHRTQRIVRSASLWQVRRPLYASSVGRWRHYARHIGPLLDAFGHD